MAIKAILKIGLIGVVTALSCQSAVGQATSYPAASTASHLPPLKLAPPNWQPLTAPEIVATFSGQSLVVDENYEPYPGVKVWSIYVGGCPPREYFGADGAWSKVICSRALMTYTGRWSTEKFRGGARLCVEAQNFRKLCRFVWVASRDTVIMAADSMIPLESQDDPSTFTPFRWIRTPK